jgi:fructose-1,6-bisphosphatase/inositol monophosphatase family enzyme
MVDITAQRGSCGPCGWDYGAGHALIRGAGGIPVDEHGHEVTYTVDGSSYTCFCFGDGLVRCRIWRCVTTGAVCVTACA